MTVAKFQRKAPSLLTEIRDSVQRLGDRQEPEDSEWHVEQISHDQELCDLEEDLKIVNNRQLLISRLAKIGGVDCRDHTNKG